MTKIDRRVVEHVLESFIDGMLLSQSRDPVEAVNGRLIMAEVTTLIAEMSAQNVRERSLQSRN